MINLQPSSSENILKCLIYLPYKFFSSEIHVGNNIYFCQTVHVEAYMNGTDMFIPLHHIRHVYFQ